MVYVVQFTLDTNTLTTTFTLSATIRFLTLHFLKKKVPYYKEGNHPQHQFSRTQTQGTGNHQRSHVISGFRREVDANCDLLGYCTASSGYFLPTFRDILSVPPSGVKNSWPLNVCNNWEQRSSHDRLHLQHVSHRDSRSITARGFNTAEHFTSKWYPQTVDRRSWNSLKTFSSVRSVFQCLFTAASNTTLWQSLLPKTVRCYLQLNTATRNFMKI
jgi:hypothetical protein